MSRQDQTPGMDKAADKFELHYRQQLSALVDGELAADEARFMLRRLQHDGELSSCQERWQLLGDVMRGQACAPAPLDFSARVRAAVDADALQNGPVAAASHPQRTARTGWRRWGGGAALAASVAAVALFMAREQLPETAAPAPVIAATAEVSLPQQPAPATPAPVTADAGDIAALVAAAPSVAAAAARRQEANGRRGSATRTQQAARAGALRSAEPERAIASAPVLPALRQQDPFASGNGVLPARPWPRSSVAPSLSQGALNASYPAQESGGATFYPFEPRLPAQGADESGLPRLAPHP
ncbi:sigma-E factor negative regulatory protein [Stenotrophomonas sp.]|uniref:sigma-E factor negative regulatory protein n=2 Tax=Stenotrophomonas sp. TaxID=69392 RepID=UPI0028AC16B7|nr:sigma-E factor negative regulatory protein [Stenotrophomonas sp.]